jgi:glycosyltransferase involved in cell wall biosynthesis
VRILMFGAFDAEYARNQVLRSGLRRAGVAVDVCRAPLGSRSLHRTARLVAGFVRRRQPDAILVPEFRHKDVPLARFLADVQGVPLIVDPLVSRYDTKIGDWGSAQPGSFQAAHNRRLDRAAVRFADLVLCDTAAHARYFQRHYRVPVERLAVVPVGYDDAVFRPLPAPPPAPFRVAFYGSFLPLHGIDVIVAAARQLADRDMRFMLIGGGQTWDLAAAAQRDGLALELVPALPPRQLVERLRNVHVVLGIFGQSAKAARVVPNKVYQALALERALVSADSPALREFFVPGEHLLGVPAGDPGALAAALWRLRTDAALRDRLARSGAAWVHARFNPEAVARTLLRAGRDTLGWTVAA